LGCLSLCFHIRLIDDYCIPYCLFLDFEQDELGAE
jgi:hypothetical protein